MVPTFSKIRTYIAKIKIWLVSQLYWTKFDTEQLQVTGKTDDNASLLLLKSKMVLIIFLCKIGYGASVAVLTLFMLSLSLIFSGPAQNSDAVQKPSTLHFKYFRFQVPSSVGYDVQPLRGHLSACWCVKRKPREWSSWKQNCYIIEYSLVLFPPASPRGQFVVNYHNANSLWRLMEGKGDFYLQNLCTDFFSLTCSHPYAQHTTAWMSGLAVKNWCRFAVVPFRSGV